MTLSQIKQHTHLFPLAPRRQAISQAIKYLKAIETLGVRWLFHTSNMMRRSHD